MSIYIRYNGFLCVSARLLYKDLQMVSYKNYENYVRRDKITKVRRGGGKNCPALIKFKSLPYPWQDYIIKQFGDPYEGAFDILIEDYLQQDHAAVTYYREYTLADGRHLPKTNQREYVANASVLNAVIAAIQDVGSEYRNQVSNNWRKLSLQVQGLDQERWHVKLPKSGRKLKLKANEYNVKGYECLISGKFMNDNSLKLTSVVKKWILARYSDAINRCNIRQLFQEYNQIATEKGWKIMKDARALENYLMQPEVKAEWRLARQGKESARRKTGFLQKTQLPVLRDVLWEADATKFNIYYMEEYTDKNGKTKYKQSSMFWHAVVDVYSETILGFSMAKTETYEMQHEAYKMAIKTSGYLPVELRYDGQGGNQKLKHFYDSIAQHHRRTRPYNGQSKSIESIFGRFQQELEARHLFYTGQNMGTKKDTHRGNHGLQQANRDQMPTKEELYELLNGYVNEWNNLPHPKTGEPRIEMYDMSCNTKTKEVDMLDMVELFWVQRDKKITYQKGGLAFTEKGIKYEYSPDVYNKDVKVIKEELQWHQANLGKKFIVKFDPSFDDLFIMLYEDLGKGNTRFVRELQPKVAVHRAMYDQRDGEMEDIQRLIAAEKELYNDIEKRLYKNLEEHGRAPHQYNMSAPKSKKKKKSANSGQPSANSNQPSAESRKPKPAPVSEGEIMKAESNQDEELDAYERHHKMMLEILLKP